MRTRELHRKEHDSALERYSIRLEPITIRKIARLTKDGWDMTEFVRSAVVEAVDDAYREKVGAEGEAA